MLTMMPGMPYGHSHGQASRVGGYLVNAERLAHDEKTPDGIDAGFTGLGRLIPGS